MSYQKDECPNCNGLKDKRAMLCRFCKDKEPEFKKCNGCQMIFPISNFGIRPNGRKDGHKRRGRCKSCESLASKARQIANPHLRAKIKKRYKEKDPIRYQKMKKYWSLRKSWKQRGYDPDKIANIYKENTFTHCAVCKEETDLVLDHNHDTMQLRGFLCNKCNLGIGLFQDRPQLLEAAAFYLIGYQTKTAS